MVLVVESMRFKKQLVLVAEGVQALSYTSDSSTQSGSELLRYLQYSLGHTNTQQAGLH